MTAVLTAAEMRAAEQAAIDSGRVTGLALMERAGQGVVEAILQTWPALARAVPVQPEVLEKAESAGAPCEKRRAVVLCGPGNNGGDGFVVARLLAQRGWEVEVLFYGDADRLPPDARVNYRRWLALGGVQPLTYRAVKEASDPDIWLDAVFGIGLSRRATGDLEKTLCYLAGYGGDRAFLQPKLVAVDVPSGLHADTGEVIGKGAEEWAPPCPFCALTVTFHRPKPGHVMGDGPVQCGKLIVKDIGL